MSKPLSSKPVEVMTVDILYVDKPRQRDLQPRNFRHETIHHGAIQLIKELQPSFGSLHSVATQPWIICLGR
ncbi:hypothetical protein IPC1284_08340 [Pseudomonas aeruginosa]|nr:hypothetical protein A6747_26420 [Pseudomonas aeruginosa]RPN07102.1 hypothetical protein IPC1284_08340 [Pseudomonas aeruginosa]HBP5424507.1 hypothetical protein [Pseudomonas aeruginosa]